MVPSVPTPGPSPSPRDHEGRLQLTRLGILAAISRALAASPALEPLLETVRHEVGRLFNLDGFVIVLVQPGVPDWTSACRFVQGPGDALLRCPGRAALLGRTLQSALPLLVSDLGDGPASWMSVPLTAGDQVLGAMALQSPGVEGAYDLYDLELFTAIASQIAASIRINRLYEDAHRRAQEMETLVATGQNVSSSLELETVLDRAARDTLAQITGDTLGIFLREPGGIFRAVAASGNNAQSLRSFGVHPGSGILGDIAITGIAEIANDATGDPRAVCLPGSPPNEPGEKLMGVPLTLDGEVIGLMCIWRIPAHPPFEEADLRFLEAIGRQVIIAIWNARLFGEARQAQAEAERANRAKSTFLASMSHELRTPLHAILGFAQLMRHVPDRPPGDLQSLGKIQRAGEHLLGLINDVLSIAQIESGRLVLNLGTLAFRQLLQDIGEMIRVRAQGKGLSLELLVHPDVPAFLHADGGKLRQVLINLLGNAVKFTAEGTVSLAVFPLGGRIGFEVRDTGVGLAPEEQAVLFSAFTQTSAGKASREGTGLGLHISQVLVRLMGGEISVESRVGHGSTFRFALPFEPAQPAVAEDPPAGLVLGPAPGQGVRRMLVVDDHPYNREVLGGILGRWGLEVREAVDGAEAVRLWEDWRPDVVWMDLRMPGMDGWEATRAIRQREAGLGLARTCLLAVSASVLDVDRQTLLGAGFDEFVPKPFLEEQIAQVLEQHAGLAFRRGERPPCEDSGPLDAAWLRSLPESWRVRFRQALILGDRPAALALLADVAQGPGIPAVERRLREFRFEELLAGLGPV